MSTFKYIGNALVVLSAIEAWTFVVLYAIRFPWWTNPMGRHVMSLMAVIAAVLALTVVRLIGGATLDTGWFLALRVIVFAMIPVVLGWRLVILIRASHKE